MARAKSVVLSPAEKKALVATKKEALKNANIVLKEAVKFGKEKEKLHAATMKDNGKKVAAATKDVEKLTAELAVLTAKPAPAAA